MRTVVGSFLLFLSASAMASEIRVPADYPTIQSAINAARVGDTIVVAPGVYPEYVEFRGKVLTLRSENPTDFEIVKSTIINGYYNTYLTNNDYTIRFDGQEASQCVLEGFTIQEKGIEGNHCHATIRNNLIIHNWGVPAIRNMHGLIYNNIIAYNYNSYFGTIVFCDGIIENNILYGNGSSGGIALHRCNGIIRNCIAWDGAHATFSRIIESSTPSFCCIQGYEGGGEGNISVDPRFIAPASMEFHFFPNSPCIDAGGASTLAMRDLEGRLRPIDSIGVSRGDGSDVDMGALEFTGTGVENSPPSTPIHVFPNAGEDYASIVPPLRVGGFEDPDIGDTVAAVDWEVSTGTFSTEPFLTQRLQGGEPTVFRIATGYLEFDTVYWWRARFLDNQLLAGPWSQPTSFRTRPKGASFVVYPENGNSIQSEIDGATDTDELIVSPGIYRDNLTIQGKNITLRSLDPENPDIVKATIIDGALEDVITFGHADSDSVVSGLTLQGGYWGIVGPTSNVRILLNRIIHNQGGIKDVDGLIERNIIAKNTFEGGLLGCDGTIINNVIAFNRAPAYQGYYCYYPNPGGINPRPVCYLTLFGGLGGGLNECSGLVAYNTLYENWASWEGSAFYECTGELIGNIIVGDPGTQRIANSSVAVASCIPGETDTVTGTIGLDPRFVDPEHGDFRLRADSPCIDAGNIVPEVFADFLGYPRPYDGVSSQRGDGSDYDMGAIEYRPQVGDYSRNGYLDPMDLFQFEKGWREVTAPSSDANLNRDDRIDAADLLLWLREWKTAPIGLSFD